MVSRIVLPSHAIDKEEEKALINNVLLVFFRFFHFFSLILQRKLYFSFYRTGLDSMNGKDEMINIAPQNTLFLQEKECPPVVPESLKANSSGADFQWFVMRSTYSREMKAKEILEHDGIECYVPTKRVRSFDGEEACDSDLPLVHNLIFVRTNRDIMDSYKRCLEFTCPIRYAIDKSTSKPMVVRDKEMEDFMRVTKEASDSIRFLDDPEQLLQKGQDVEVIHGPFTGIEGKIVRFHRDRRVVVSLAGLMAVAMSSMPITWLKIKGNEQHIL